MPALNFSKRFAAAVEAGTKRQTIRTVRKRRPIRLRDTLYMYTGMRTKSCRGLGNQVCKDITQIQISRHPLTGEGLIKASWGVSMYILNEFAQADGFDNVEDMLQWFDKTHGLPFTGVLIRW